MKGIETIDIGNRRELFVDEYLIQEKDGRIGLVLHEPVAQPEAFVTDKPWEGNMCGFVTTFEDGGTFRMYYKAWALDLNDPENSGESLAEEHTWVIGYAESSDGKRWNRPELGLIDFGDSKRNNIVWQGEGPTQNGIHGFAPFRDDNPACAPEARYKAVGGERRATKGSLYAMKSSDGLRWSMLRNDPIITDGKFDSQNLAFWDSARGEYRAYFRDFHSHQGDFAHGVRGIKTATSEDFLSWSEPEWLEYPNAPSEQLYTNQIVPYHRAPHIFLGFPTRYVERTSSAATDSLPEPEHRRLRSGINDRFGAALTDGLFMSSRDGRTFKRWGEAFLRPGLRTEGNWAYGDNYQAWGLLETESDIPGAPRELSIYSTEHYWRGDFTRFRRFTLRMDGFVSMRASRAGGRLTTVPLRFSGSRLTLNFSASAAGSILVELQDADGKPLDGHALDDCVRVLGDSLDRTVVWSGGSDLSAFTGTPVKLRFVMEDADLYSFQFTEDRKQYR